jgi:parvulin-like peptidyl-prolyl isomerase
LGTPPEPKAPKRADASEKKAAADPKTDLTPPWKKAEKAKTADEDEEDDDDDDDDDDDEDDDDEDEDDEDEDEDEEDRRKARARASKAKASIDKNASDRKAPAAPGWDDWIPDSAPIWVLAGILVLGFAGGLGLLPLNFNLKPAAAPAVSATPTTTASTKARPSSSALREQMRERRRKAMAADGGTDGQMIRASHLLVAYKDAMRSTQTRTKAEAKARAEEALKRAKKGEDFTKVVAAYTDEPGGADRGGDLRKFGHGQMVPEFDKAAFALKVNEISGIVETPFGFHVIKRTE